MFSKENLSIREEFALNTPPRNEDKAQRTKIPFKFCIFIVSEKNMRAGENYTFPISTSEYILKAANL